MKSRLQEMIGQQTDFSHLLRNKGGEKCTNVQTAAEI